MKVITNTTQSEDLGVHCRFVCTLFVLIINARRHECSSRVFVVINRVWGLEHISSLTFMTASSMHN